jgi:hypothetical protein
VRKLGLRGVAVFVDESSEPVAAFHGGRGGADDAELATRCCRRRQMERAVRPVRVVVVGEHLEDALEVAKVHDEEPVEAFGADGAYEALGDRVCLRRSHRRLDDLDPFSGEDDVEVARELPSRSRIGNRNRGGCSWSVHAIWRARCVTQAPVGPLVQPARCTRRLATSMKNET